MVIQPKLTLLGVTVVPQVSRESESELDEEINLAAASDTDVGDCGLEGRESSTDMVGRLLVGVRMVGVATVAGEEFDITAATRPHWGHCCCC